MPYLILGTAIALPILITVVRAASPANRVTPWLIPRLLHASSYSKSVLRRAGTGWIAFSLWIGTFVIFASNALPDVWTKRYGMALGVVTATVLFTSFLLLICGLYFLVIGVWARAEVTKITLQSVFAADPNELDAYVRRLRRWSRINLWSGLFVVALPVLEGAIGVKPERSVVLINVALLITFILSLWRMRAYIMKSTTVMDQVGGPDILPAPGGSGALLLVRSHSRRVLKRYETFQSSRWNSIRAEQTRSTESAL